MIARITLAASLFLTLLATSSFADGVSGNYLEARTCQVYTGPCFANAEIGIAGKEAIMAWNIEQGQQGGVDLAGLNVVVVVAASDTLAFRGIEDARSVKSIILVDRKANAQQRAALIEFARRNSGKAGESVQRIDVAPIAMNLDTTKLTGQLTAGKSVKLSTRKANPKDCICSNESAYYPPLAGVDRCVAGVTIDGGFSGRGLGTQWSIPDSRSAFMATFAY